MINWKIIAIIFIVITVIESSIFIYGFLEAKRIEKETYQCYYDFCAEYPEAFYQDPVCTCEGYDILGNLIVQKEGLLK